MKIRLTASKQEELFSTECKLINLKYEYQGYIAKSTHQAAPTEKRDTYRKLWTRKKDGE